MITEHKEGCIYDGKNVLYALQEVCGKKFIIAASEVSLLDTYLEYAKNEDKDLSINYNEADNEPYQIVYGSIIVNPLYDLKFDEMIEMINDMKGYALLELIDDEKIRVSGYDDIYILEHGKTEGNYPFVALMKSKDTFNPDYSSTMFPALDEHCVWESLVNRRFLLACRWAEQLDNLTMENWRSFISEDKMIEINEVADLYTGED